MFQIGSKVFYPTAGVCLIDEVKPLPFPGSNENRLYYCLHPLHRVADRLFVPVDADPPLLRSLISRDEAEELMESVHTIEVIEESNVKLLKDKMNQALNKHDCREWFRIIKTVHFHGIELARRSKRISDTERSLSDTARRYLYGELACVLDNTPDEVGARIRSIAEGASV